LHQYIRLARVVLLQWMLMIIDTIGPVLSRLLSERAWLPHGTSGSGISVIIPERANPALLEECIESVMQASREITEPVEVIVVVNGSSRALYEQLCSNYRSVRWVFFENPLWFSGAVHEGLQVARYDWVYLLNSDMTVDPHAISELVPWRAPHVFAIASQISFKDPARRREETGWTRFRESGGMPEIFDAPPEDELVRGTFYAGGGASLFQKALLKRIATIADIYNPFYWEDVEWGTVAWRCGFESLFCPKSRVWHHHRATNRLFFSESEIERIFRRNMVKYELRNRVLAPAFQPQLFRRLYRLDGASFREVMTPSGVAGILWSRLRYWTYPFRKIPLQYTWRKYYMKPWSAAAEKPTILIATPYAIYPPSHGGAVRLHNLIVAISNHYNVILLSDEADRYSELSLKYFGRLASVHLISGRTGDTAVRRIQRIKSHSHSDLKAVLQMLVACCAPALVQVEFMELAKLIDVRHGSIPWLLTLHEVWISKKAEAVSSEDRYELALIRKFDAIITCSEEDAQLLNHPALYVVPNGANVHAIPYCPSLESGPILFMGPFRYLPNLQGIQRFLEAVYPHLLQSIPNLHLWVLGGNGAAKTASQMACFDQQGVTVVDHIEQPRPLLDQCAITINPLRGVRGSCLKIAESIAAGRVCISTTEGARGFLNHSIPALVAVDKVEEFEAPIKSLLSDTVHRRSLEEPSPRVLDICSWENGAKRMLAIYSRMIESGTRAT